jgi:hypothetical protein
VANDVPRVAAKGLGGGFYDLLLHVESASAMDFHRSSRAELDAVQTRLRVADDEAKLVLERHAGALGIARRNLPWGGLVRRSAPYVGLDPNAPLLRESPGRLIPAGTGTSDRRRTGNKP